MAQNMPSYCDAFFYTHMMNSSDIKPGERVPSHPALVQCFSEGRLRSDDARGADRIGGCSRGSMDPRQAQGGHRAICNRKSHVIGSYEAAESQFGGIERSGGAVAEVGLSSREGVFQVCLGCRVVTSEPVGRELRDGDCRQDADDGHDDHQLDQREALLVSHFREIANHDALLLLCHFYIFFVISGL
jgi:hypothetical protein